MSAAQQQHAEQMRLTSLLVYTVGVKCHGFDGVGYAPENAANKLVKAKINELIRHTYSHRVRTLKEQE
jgi:phosphatidylinositol phospholipase C delta